MNRCRFLYMRFLILLFSAFSAVASAPQPLGEEELPFSTDNFPTFLDDVSSNSAEEKDELALSYADQAETLKKRLKMKSMFNTNGPPAIGSDLFSNAAVEDNIKKVSYEGSGSGVDENPSKSEEEGTTSTLLDSLYSANNATIEDSAVESSSSNSSILYDQNTSDVEVETISDTVYQKAEASAVLQASQTESKNKNDYEGSIEKSKSATVPDFAEYTGNDTTSKVLCPPPQMCGKNCFVTLNDDGCQDCQCLWIAADCEVDQDCSEKNQYCDLGKCNCQPGYQQNMRKSGVCEVEAKKSLVVTETETNNNQELNLNEISKRIEELKRNKRESKPRRSERLEWPGRLQLW